MKIVIAGDGTVGDSLTRQLSGEGYDLTLIDSNESVLKVSVDRYDVMAVCGNCASRDVLLQAGVRDADLLIAATSADEVNLLSCMTSHELNPRLQTIARIRNPEYTDQIYDMSGAFALSLVVNPEKQAAEEIENLLKYPGFLKRESFIKGRVQIVELQLPGGSRLLGKSLNDVINNVLRFPVLVCIVQRGGETITPRGDFVLQKGDRLFVTAPSQNLEQLLKKLGLLQKNLKKVLLCGGGRISYYLAAALSRDGVDVTMIERKHERCVELSGLLPRVNVVCGEPADRHLLESEGLRDCDALVTLTDYDETNLIVSLLGHNSGVGNVVTKLTQAENVSLLGDLPIGSVVSPAALCGETIARYVSAMRNQTGSAVAVHAIAGGKAEAMEFAVDERESFCGVPLKNLHMKKGVIVACISSGARTRIPTGNSVMNAGDSVVIVTTGDTAVTRLGDIFA